MALKIGPCTKRGWRTELDAKIALASTHFSRKSQREETRFYFHKQCRRYHLTSQPKRVKGESGVDSSTV